MTIAATVQSLSPGERVALYQLDTTILGGGVYHFTSGTDNMQPVTFGGIQYFPVDLQVDGFEWNGQGQLPRPRMKISNAANFLGAAVITMGDLIGSTLIRIRTYRQFLDDGATPNPSMIFPLDIFRVDRKSNFNKVFIEWELATVMDQQGRMLPGRQIIKHNCTHTYRYYNPTTGLFDYAKASCPYTGSNYFATSDTAVVSASQDACGKLLSSCRARFGLAADLPFRGYPGAGEN